MEEDVIRAEKLNKVFSIKGKKPLTALNGLSLSVKKGELTAVIGPDGAGKTTLMRLIAGLMNPTSGSLTVLGMDSVKVRKKSRAEFPTCRRSSAFMRI